MRGSEGSIASLARRHGFRSAFRDWAAEATRMPLAKAPHVVPGFSGHKSIRWAACFPSKPTPPDQHWVAPDGSAPCAVGRHRTIPSHASVGVAQAIDPLHAAVVGRLVLHGRALRLPQTTSGRSAGMKQDQIRSAPEVSTSSRCSPIPRTCALSVFWLQIPFVTRRYVSRGSRTTCQRCRIGPYPGHLISLSVHPL